MSASRTADLPRLPSSEVAAPAAIYVHWPFCLKKCPYCDFNSHVREKVSHKDWQNALVREIDTFAAHYPKLVAKSIFFGGGTPSLMEPETVAAVIETIHKHWAPAGDVETTLEANPSSVEAERFRGYRNAGVNRLSVGIQSLNDNVLRFLGRLHSAREALNALKVAQDNFDRVSFDLIYARPEQTIEGWKAELEKALSFGTGHLSLYQLTIEEGTAFYNQFHRGKFSLPDEDLAAALFDLTQNLTEKAGLPAYEISNHAQPGQESLHNLNYWQGGYYVGIGPGAHGRIPGHETVSTCAHAQIKRPEDWLKAVVSRGTGVETLEDISAEERIIEQIMMGLRLTEGLDAPGFAQAINETVLNDLVLSGHIERIGNRISLTKKGRPLLNFILGKLVA